MEIARQWLEVQRATPSFAGDASLVPVDDALLRGPLPAGLEGEGSDDDDMQYHHQSHNKSKSARYAATPIHEQLLAKGKLYQQRKEAMKERHVSDQLRHVRNPRVSDQAKQLKRDEKIHERFRRLQQQKDEKAYYQQRQREQQDTQVLSRSFKPSITARARQASARIGGNRIGDALETQMRRRDERASQVRLKYLMHDMAEVREVPSINPVSEKLAARRREKEGMANLTQLEAMIERDRIRQAALWEKKQEKELEETANPYPKITLYAASLQRDGDAAERLYAESLEAEARRVERIQSNLSSTNVTHTPRITAKAANTRTRNADQPVEDELMRRHLDSMAHREELLRQQLERERERRTPAINPVSDTIASRLAQTSRERLAQPKAQFVDANEPRFAPRINQMPPPRSSSQDPDDEQQQRQYGGAGTTPPSRYGSTQYEQRRNEKLRQLREEADARQMAECTFQPSIHTNPNAMGGGGGGSGGSGGMMGGGAGEGNEASLIDRSAQWLKRREAKLQAQRSQQASPNAIDPSASVLRSSAATRSTKQHRQGSSSNHPHEEEPQGVDDFVERLEEGRKRRHDQYTKLYATGSHWTGEATVPSSEYRPASGAEAPPVRSLKPPVSERVSLAGLTPPPK